MGRTASGEHGGPEPKSGTFASTLFAQFVKAMDPHRRLPALLDLGPTVPQNLMFWAERGFKVTARDVLGHPHAPVEIPEDARFGGVLCWNVLPALTRADAVDLMRRLRHHMEPGGALFAIFDGDGRHLPAPVRYRIAGPDRLTYEPIQQSLQLRAIANSEIEQLLRGFRPTRLTVMRHGSREALGVLDPESGAGER